MLRPEGGVLKERWPLVFGGTGGSRMGLPDAG